MLQSIGGHVLYCCYNRHDKFTTSRKSILYGWFTRSCTTLVRTQEIWANVHETRDSLYQFLLPGRLWLTATMLCNDSMQAASRVHCIVVI